MSRQSERAVLASILFDPDCIITARDRIEPDVFRHANHRVIYTAMLACADKRNAPDITNVSMEMDRGTESSSIGSLADLMSDPVVPVYFSSYLDTLLRDHTRDTVVRACTQIIQEVQASDEIDPEELIHGILTNLPRFGTAAGLVPFADMADTIMTRLDQQRDGTWIERVTPTGFPTLDKKLGGGFRPGELIVLAARPAIGKSAAGFRFAINAARHVAPALIYSLEMPGISIFERAIADAAALSMSTVRNKRITAEQHRLLSDVTNQMRKVPVHVDDTSGLTTDQAITRTQRFMAENACSLVVADYLEIMGDRNDKSEERRVGKISERMKHLARACDVPAVLLVQLSRKVEDRKPPIPVLSDLRYSGSIEANADIVLMMYRHDYYEEQGLVDYDPTRTKTCDLFIRKQRNGETATVTLGFEPSTMTFSDPATPPAPWEVRTA